MGGRDGTAVLVLTRSRAQPRPERVVSAAPPEVETVDLAFPARSGLQAELETAGFRLRWVREEQVARRREQGWEAVVVERDGRRLTFRVPPAMPADDPAVLVLMKHRAFSAAVGHRRIPLTDEALDEQRRWQSNLLRPRTPHA